MAQPSKVARRTPESVATTPWEAEVKWRARSPGAPGTDQRRKVPVRKSNRATVPSSPARWARLSEGRTWTRFQRGPPRRSHARSGVGFDQVRPPSRVERSDWLRRDPASPSSGDRKARWEGKSREGNRRSSRGSKRKSPLSSRTSRTRRRLPTKFWIRVWVSTAKTGSDEGRRPRGTCHGSSGAARTRTEPSTVWTATFPPRARIRATPRSVGPAESGRRSGRAEVSLWKGCAESFQALARGLAFGAMRRIVWVCFEGRSYADFRGLSVA